MTTTTTGSAASAEPTRGRTMKAVVRVRYGSADVLELRDADVPLVGDDEVLVRVRASGLDRGAWHVMAGLPYLIRIAGYGVRAPKIAGLGSELAGVVEAVGSHVTDVTPAKRCSASAAPRSPNTRRRAQTGWHRCRPT
jgi:NADPH:quinone reductase-like Zn-dependent oxidoreductase